MKNSSPSQKGLAKKVAERQRFLEQVIHFVHSMVMQRGKRLKYDESSDHTYSVRELQDFCGFTFTTEGAYTMFGGQNIVVHCDGSQESKRVVLEVEWWDIKELHVHAFEPNIRWQRSLLRLMQDPKTALARYDKGKAEEAKRATKANPALQEADERLQAAAKRLGL